MKNKITKTITGVALATLLFTFTGCFDDGIDDNQYAILTGDKTFEQIKNSYSLSISNQLPKDEKIYEKWLKDYDDSDPAFNFKNYHLKTHLDYDVMIGKFKNLIKELKLKKTHNKRDLKRELRSAQMLSSHIKYIRTDYIPYLKSLIDKKSEIKEHKQTELLPYPTSYKK